MTPRRKSFVKELEYFQRVLIRRHSFASFRLLKLEHRAAEMKRQFEAVKVLSDEKEGPVRLSGVYKRSQPGFPRVKGQ